MTAPAFKPDSIPAELRAWKRWICWRLEDVPGREKPAKVPYVAEASARRRAKTTDERDWATFDEALAARESGGFDGIGFVFTATPYVGVDLDGTVGDDGTLSNVAREFVDALPGAYVERSQSGRGLHLIAKGQLPVGGRRNGKVEMYDASSPRYFALTGDAVGPIPAAVPDHTAAVGRLHSRWIGSDAPQPVASTTPAPQTAVSAEAVAALVEAARKGRHWRRFIALFDEGADVQGRGRDSELDSELAAILCELTDDEDLVVEGMAASDLAPARSGLVKRADVRARWPEQRNGVSYLRYTVRNVRKHVGPARPAAREEAAAPLAERWPLFSGRQLLAAPEPAWLVKDALFASGLTLLYGMKGTFKSFIALSLAAAVAAGDPWLGRPATQGTVVYVIAEGKGFFRRRVQALGCADAAIRYATVPVNLFRNGEATAFAERVRAQLGDARPALFVFDTLARSMVGAEENSNSDMAMTVEHAQALQHEFGAAVLLVHHTGKDGLTARGGYALVAASDVVLRLDKTAPRAVTLTFENTKDWEEPAPLRLALAVRAPSLVGGPVAGYGAGPGLQGCS